MKVVIVNRFFAPDQSATSRMATSLATGLVSQGFQVQVIASATYHDQPGRRLPRHDRIGSVEVFRVGATRFGRGRILGRALDYVTFHVAAAWRLFRSVRAGDVCIICTDPPLMSVSALPAVALKRAKLVNWLNDVFPEVAFQAGMMRPESLIGRLTLAMRDFTLRRAAGNVALTSRMAELLEAHGAPAEGLCIVHQWAEGDVLAPMPAHDSTVRKAWGLSDKFVVGYSGNLGRAHDFSTLLDAADMLRSREDIAFLIVGGGHRLAWVTAEIARRGLAAFRIEPLQPEALLRDCLAAPDVHFVSLLPSFETSIVPSKFYGVAAAGRPTLFVGDPQGEVARLVRDGACGAAFEVGAAAALSAEIERMAADPALVAALGVNARALFDARFSRARGLAAWRDVIVRCSSAPRASAPRPIRPVGSEIR